MLLLCALAVGCRPATDQPTIEFEAAPAFALPGLDGEVVSLEDFAGKVVVVDFWATWCAPCRVQASILEDLQEEFEPESVQFLAVNLGEGAEIVQPFTERNSMSYPVLLDVEETLGEALQIYALPTVMVVDGGGTISYLRPGISDLDTLREALAAAGAVALPAG